MLQDVACNEQTQEALALLRVLALSFAQIKAGKVRPTAETFKCVRARVKG